jgi:hypothetical protein
VRLLVRQLSRTVVLAAVGVLDLVQARPRRRRRASCGRRPGTTIKKEVERSLGSTGKPMGFNGQSCASQLATADVALGRSASRRHLGGYIGRPCDGTERSVPKITFGKNADQ